MSVKQYIKEVFSLTDLSKKKKLAAGAAIAAILVLLLVVLVSFTKAKLENMKSDELIIQSNLEMTEVSVISQTAGQIIELNVEEGDHVTEGQILARIDSDTLLTQKAKAEAGITAIEGQLRSGEASYAKVKNGTRSEELAQVQSSFNLAETTYNRMKLLYEQGGISKAEYDSAATQYEVAKQKLQLAQNGAQAEDIQMAAAQVETLKGQLESAKASLAEIETYLQKTTIEAPATGVVTQLSVEKGGLISGGMPIAVITDTSSPWIQCNVMENELSNIKLGNEVTLELGAYPGKTFKGKITAVNKSADFAVKRATNANGEFDILSYGVKVKPLDIDEELFAGMTAFVNFGPLSPASSSK